MGDEEIPQQPVTAEDEARKKEEARQVEALKEINIDKQIDGLVRESEYLTAYLGVASIAGFFGGYYYLITARSQMGFVFAVALIGFSGSSVAALTSCLDRYANGFELWYGTKVPKEAKDKDKQMFGRRMARWLGVRPYLGLVVGPVFVWGIDFFAKDPDIFLNSPKHLAFSAFLGGLLAKSVLDLIKNLFKNVFRA